MKEALCKSEQRNFNPATLMTGAILVTLVVLLFGLYINELRKIDAFSKNVAELNSELAILKNRESASSRSIDALNNELTQARESSKNVAELKSELAILKSRESTLTRTIAALNDTLSQANNQVPSKVESASAAESPKPNADLLIHFERISDPFTSPIVYQHKLFHSRLRNPPSDEKESALRRFTDMTVNSKGIVDQPLSIFRRLLISDGDKIITFKSLDELKVGFPGTLAWSGPLHFRFWWEYKERSGQVAGSPTVYLPGGGDFTLSQEELTALRQTLDLAIKFQQAK